MLDKLNEGMNFHAQALALRAERQRLLASNIANADTPGYQARDINFAQALAQATGSGGATLALAAPGRPAGGNTPSAADAALSTSARAADTGYTVSTVHPRHLPLGGSGGGLAGSVTSTAGFAAQTQPSLDNNTVDLDRERAAFADNAVRYEATLRFLNGQSKTLLSAITGQ
jgi:flagellar basal-body rod protein FlgB